MTFTENWFDVPSQDALAGLYGKVADLAGEIVEVGCWEGRSTVALANAAYPATVHAVDTWRGSPGEISETLATDRDVFATFLANVSQLTKGNVVAHRQGWREFFAGHVNPIRFLHIDATHTYDEVRDNIVAALPYVVDGGIVCGDDAHHPPIQQATTDTLGDVERVATLWWWQK